MKHLLNNKLSLCNLLLALACIWFVAIPTVFASNCPPGKPPISLSISGPAIVAVGASATYTCTLTSGDAGGSYSWNVGDFSGSSGSDTITLTASAVAGVKTVSCTYKKTYSADEVCSGSGSTSVKVVKIDSFIVVGADQWGEASSSIYAAPQEQGDVTVTAVLTPSVAASDLPAGTVTWVNGQAGGNQLERIVSKASPLDLTVTASCGSSSKNARVVVRRVDSYQNKQVTPSGSPSTGGSGNHCTPSVAKTELQWHATYDKKNDLWRVRVDSLTLVGTINIVSWPDSPNTMTVPNTPNPVLGGNINNNSASYNWWSYAVADMLDYDTVGSVGAGPHWHATDASSAHEWFHWDVDYASTCVMGSSGGNWPQTEIDMETYTVSGALNLKESDAITSLQSTVDARFETWKWATYIYLRDVILPSDLPGLGGGGYAAGASVLNDYVTDVSSYANSQGW